MMSEAFKIDPDELEALVLAEAHTLGIVGEAPSAEIKALVKDCVTAVLNDTRLSQAQGVLKLTEICDARSQQLRTGSFRTALTHKNLEKLGLNLESGDTLNRCLYPMVLIKLIEKAFPGFIDLLKTAFTEMMKEKNKNRVAYQKAVLAAVARTEGLNVLADTLKLPLKNLFSDKTAIKKLGQCLFADDEEPWKEWRAIFLPTMSVKPKIVESSAASTPEEIIQGFLQEARYFVGNPHSTPGVFVKFKKAVEAFVGEAQSRYLSIQNNSNKFTIRLTRGHFDTEALESFVKSLQSKWKNKHSNGEALVIETDFLTDGSATSGVMVI